MRCYGLRVYGLAFGSLRVRQRQVVSRTQVGKHTDLQTLSPESLTSNHKPTSVVSFPLVSRFAN